MGSGISNSNVTDEKSRKQSIQHQPRPIREVHKVTDHQKNDRRPDTRSDTNSIVEKCWKNIEKSICARPLILQDDAAQERVVRVFVSSTFVDMHSEREILLKVVFPELRLWLREYDMSLSEVDLRWGVPMQTEAADTINICMTELDRCIQSNQFPFFISLLGHRYGWVPSPADFKGSEHLRSIYSWIDQISITHMEVLHGAYRMNNPNALFMMRAADVYEELDRELYKGVVDQDPLPVAQMEMLKRKLRAKFEQNCFSYGAKYVRAEHGRPVFTGLDGDEFATPIIQFMKRAIKKHFQLRSQPTAMDEEQKMLNDEHHYINEQRAFFCGRATHLNMLTEICFEMDSVNCQNKHEFGREITIEQLNMADEMKERAPPRHKRPLLWLAGDTGAGKTAILASFMAELEMKVEPNDRFYHFVDANGNSRQVSFLLNRLLKWAGLINEQDNRQDLSELVKSELLEKLRSTGGSKSDSGKKIIIIDGVDHLDNVNSALHLDWLPITVPSNVVFIVSAANDHRPTTYRLESRGCIKLNMNGLTIKDQKEFSSRYLQQYGKKLDEEQLTEFTNHGDRLPLWLSVALEELKLFGHFNKLTAYIKRLPDELSELILMILKRKCEEDTERQDIRVKDVLAILACAEQATLTEHSMRLLLGNPKDNELSPAVVWSRTRLALLSLIDVRHDSTVLLKPVAREVVKAHLLSDDTRMDTHHDLSVYYLRCHGNANQTAIRYPFHCLAAQDFQAAGHFLQKDNRAKLLTSMQKSDFYKKLRCQQPVMSVNSTSTEMYICRFCDMGRSDRDICVFCGGLFIRARSTECWQCSRHAQSPQAKCLFCAKPVDKDGKLGCKAKMCQNCTGMGYAQCCSMLFKI